MLFFLMLGQMDLLRSQTSGGDREQLLTMGLADRRRRIETRTVTSEERMGWKELESLDLL